MLVLKFSDNLPVVDLKRTVNCYCVGTDNSFYKFQVSSRQTGSDENEKPSLMDRLLAEKSREMNNNFDLSDYNKAVSIV